MPIRLRASNNDEMALVCIDVAAIDATETDFQADFMEHKLEQSVKELKVFTVVACRRQ